MGASSSLLSVRLDASVAAVLPRIAEEHGLNEALTLEKLIVDEAEQLKLLPKRAPSSAMVSLLDEVRGLLEANPRLERDPDVTREVFNMIQGRPHLMKLYEAAISPPAGVAAEKRRQFVHQRIGRFIKDTLGLVSVEEVILPRGTDALIRGYTRLGK